MSDPRHIALALLAVVALVVVDWLLGVLAALRSGTFAAQLLPRQLETTVLPIVGALVALAAVSIGAALYVSPLTAPAAGVFYAAGAAYVPRWVADVVAKSNRLLAASPGAPNA